MEDLTAGGSQGTGNENSPDAERGKSSNKKVRVPSLYLHLLLRILSLQKEGGRTGFHETASVKVFYIILNLMVPSPSLMCCLTFYLEKSCF